VVSRRYDGRRRGKTRVMRLVFLKAGFIFLAVFQRFFSKSRFIYVTVGKG
jgi:hypothetical protein